MKEQIKKEEEEYIGNMWGWKFSMLGLVVMLIFGSLFAYRIHKYGIESVFNKDTPTVFDEQKIMHRDTSIKPTFKTEK